MAPPKCQIAVEVSGQVKDVSEVEKVLRVNREAEIVQPAAGEVLIRIRMRTINPADVFNVTGQSRHANADSREVFNPGNEGVGQVELNGPGATKFEPGQRVIAAKWPGHGGAPPKGRPFGTWQQYLTVPEEDLIAVPDEVDDEKAAQAFINPTTAAGMVWALDAPAGEWVVQTAAGSVVGRAFSAISRLRGVKVIEIVRRPEQKKELLNAGADAVICTADEDIVQRVAEITENKGAYGGIDCVAGETAGQVLTSLKKGGTLYTYGAASGFTGTYKPLDLVYGGKTLTGFAILLWLPKAKADGTAHAKLDQVMTWIKDGVIKLETGDVFPLEEVVTAVKESMRKGKKGKVLLSG
eukprot:CAMPEP_0206149306 /NCGR_PEP_ID=MMETSP1473-20131121/37710_1 /ASSEMBLY_ACC=CAM_ASM_001109 /TAXON_ID=1461547 /ORGANISM="Stichococcus sp, Strain RCC1054" /LENGTH=352 /DNA_ID=CAMNT_0053546761 /DNA_START=164 /DNA_END=1222 /DNA_ORIENTATION=-